MSRTGWVRTECRHVHVTGHWQSNTPESKTARCAEADERFGTNAVVASKTSSR